MSQNVKLAVNPHWSKGSVDLTSCFHVTQTYVQKRRYPQWHGVAFQHRSSSEESRHLAIEKTSFKHSTRQDQCLWAIVRVCCGQYRTQFLYLLLFRCGPLSYGLALDSLILWRRYPSANTQNLTIARKISCIDIHFPATTPCDVRLPVMIMMPRIAENT